MKLYKLTDSFGLSYGNTAWGENITHTASGKGELCGPGWLHAYTSPELAILLNSIHANFPKPLLWECEGEILKSDHGLKVGTTKLTTIKQIPKPVYSLNQRVAFGILCALETGINPQFMTWANEWLDNKDRTLSKASAMTKIIVRITSAESNAVAAAIAAATKINITKIQESITLSAEQYAARSALRAAHFAADRTEVLNLQALALKALTYS